MLKPDYYHSVLRSPIDPIGLFYIDLGHEYHDSDSRYQPVDSEQLRRIKEHLNRMVEL